MAQGSWRELGCSGRHFGESWGEAAESRLIHPHLPEPCWAPCSLLLTEQARHPCPHLLGLHPIPSEAYGLGGPGWPGGHGQGSRQWH